MSTTDSKITTIGVGTVRTHHIPDILDVIAALSSDAIPTPPLLARALLDLLPIDVWSNPDYRWLDPATKSGSILREVARRLMEGLAKWEPDPQARAQHILKNMLFGAAITQVHGEMTRRSVYVSRDAAGAHSAVLFDDPQGNLPFIQAEHDYPTNRDGRASGPCRICGAPVRLERGSTRENYAYAFIHGAYPTEEMKDMKFDVIVGNPPYQIGTGGFGASASPVYQLFVDHAINLNPKYLVMIIPSRWFTGGKGLDDFRARMIADRHIVKIVDNPKLFDCFPGVEIKGGVNYFLWDRDHDGDCEFSTRIDGTIISTTTRDLRVGHGVIIRDNLAQSIVEKCRPEKVEDSLVPRFSMRAPFGQSLETNFSGAADVPFEGSLPLIFGSHIGYIRPDQIEKNAAWVKKWKVLVPVAGDGHGREVSYVLGEPIALAPGSACTQTYLVAGVFDTKTEARNYADFLTTKLVRFLVLQRKSTQHLRSDRLRFVPMLDMQRQWTDENLFDHFGLTQAERDYVESSIHPREAILSLDSPIPPSHLPGGSKYRAPGTERDATEALDTDVEDEE
ncbi:site-specific DNA-methyltransferase (adenine-specific) [Ferrithrix thermotolerans DSM 19514]|uniref:Site-specific DNA-methyltransferase (Adenine-specific) n=1 Tax=Ferrithrix thermotolerans DSM 19514 TaxID=1121881 RepID=A0A1M4WDB8_9ACTN|nr:Eco57I restriction-modification methylase domain-containing protein [Ferrithrix thermotolerans]SHE79177.1 site-specific DNA-methyltransferase (adenine-specific) [Ferrithrix thermotolerans DSM 19514]